VTRLFVAVWPSDDVCTQLEDLERPKDPGVKWVPADNLHVTLRFLGDADIDEVSDRLGDVTLPRVTARVGPANDVFAERSLILPVAGVDELAAVVVRATRGLGTERERAHYLGHITLARLARGARPNRSVGARFTAEFEVDEVALVASTLTPSGAQYDTVGTWPTR
jgi:2'-5' RNA ligase